MRRERDLSGMLRLMADDLTQRQARPVRRRLTQIIDALEAVRARYAICGAVAMGAHGVQRFTRDIDILVDERDVDRLLASLPASLRAIAREPAAGPVKQVLVRSRRARTSAAVDVDLLVPVDALEEWALSTSVRARAFERKVDVASVEALILLKLRAYLSDPESPAGGKHRADALRLVHEVRFDAALLRRLVSSDPPFAAELDRALASPPSRGRIPK